MEQAINPKSRYRTATVKQIKFGKELGLDLNDDSMWVASARLQDELYRLNQLKLEELDLKLDDPVTVMQVYGIDGTTRTWEKRYIVSSIGDSGRVYFKGGNGNSAWPSQLKKVP